MNHLANNLRKLRLEKKLTQEQIAILLGVSAQSVSRWETSATLPDVMLLPEIARLYGVLVDDLFREPLVGYENLAHRLVAVYEQTGRHEDFMAAAAEFAKLVKAETATAEDWRCYGIIHEYMVGHCTERALEYYDQAMKMSKDSDPLVYYRTQRQRIQLLSLIGQGAACIAEQEQMVKAAPENPEEWISLVSAYYTAKQYEAGYQVCKDASSRFPDTAMLHGYLGDFSRALKRYDEAFPAWETAVRLDSRFLDSMFSMAFCHEELKQYDKACDVWTQIADILCQRGLDVDAQWPREMAEKCRGQARSSHTPA